MLRINQAEETSTRPVRLPSACQFNNHVPAGDSRGRSLAFLNIICDATSFQGVSCLGEITGPRDSGIVLRHFPHSLVVVSWGSALTPS